LDHNDNKTVTKADIKAEIDEGYKSLVDGINVAIGDKDSVAQVGDGFNDGYVDVIDTSLCTESTCDNVAGEVITDEG